jgi:Trypsin
MPRVVLVLGTMALTIMLAGGVAQAIINGQPDRGPDAHPYVGALVTVPPSGEFKGQRVPVCSGTLISPRIFLTAGHCTDFLIKEKLPTYVSFDPTYKVGASKVIKAIPYTHPKFCFPTPEDKGKCRLPPGRPDKVGTLPRDIRYDVGVAVLEEPVRMVTYGALPQAGLVDTLKEGQRLTTVGYGANGFHIDREPPLAPQPVYRDDRYRATVRLLNTKDPTIGEMFVKTTGVSLTGGKGESSCYGDSGGALFVPGQQTVVGVTSFGIAPLCRGPGYYQRMDLPRVLKWVRSFPKGGAKRLEL